MIVLTKKMLGGLALQKGSPSPFHCILDCSMIWDLAQPEEAEILHASFVVHVILRKLRSASYFILVLFIIVMMM